MTTIAPAPKPFSALRALAVTLAAGVALGLPLSASAVNCGIADGKHYQDMPAIACPNGTCPADALDEVAKAVAVGCDPPVTLRPALGTAIQSNTGTTTPSGYCAPGVNALPGSPLCPVYNVNGNPNTIANNGAGASIFGAGGTGATGLAAQLGTNILNQALNQPPQNTGTTIPPLPCGGAVGLLNQILNIGGVQIGQPPASATPTAVHVIGNMLGTGTCVGSTLALPTNEVSLLLPQTTGTTPITGGTVTPPAGSIISVPGGTPVKFDLNNPGTIILPSGATLTGPAGNIITIPQNSTLTSLGGGTLQLQDGTTLVYDLNNPLIVNPGGTISINTTAIGVPPGTTLPVDANGKLVTPQAG